MKLADANHLTLLSEVAEISAGHPIRSAVDELPEGDMGVVQMRNVDPESGVDWGGVRRVELPPARRVEPLEPGDVIFTTRGTRNYAAALDGTPFPAVCSPHFFVIRIHSAAIDPSFLAWQINQAPAQEYFQREATGSYILNIRREVIERLEIALPPLGRQAVIVALAEAAKRERQLLSALIDNRQQQMSALAAALRKEIKE
jgi:hypothetical protein